LSKKYVEGETKEQRKARKELEKAQKSVETSQILPQESVEEKYYVLCLKHGTKYSADYVNKLYNGVKRHCTLDFEFVCLTEDPSGINDDITVLPLPGGISGWWCKPYIFSNDLPLKGTVLYIDLDVVIANNIDKLFTWQPDRWCTLRDFTRVMRPTWHKYNSSVIRFRVGDLDFVWTEYKKDRTFAHGGIRGTRRLRTIEHCKPKSECCITVFHGDPNPENCLDPWVVDNWR